MKKNAILILIIISLAIVFYPILMPIPAPPVLLPMTTYRVKRVMAKYRQASGTYELPVIPGFPQHLKPTGFGMPGNGGTFYPFYEDDDHFFDPYRIALTW